MHVVMVNNYLYVRGGSERVMFEEAETLDREGIRVSYFGQQRDENPPLPHNDLFPAYVDPFTLSSVGKLAHVPRIVYNAEVKRRFAQFIDRVQPNLIHGHNIYGGLTTAICDVAHQRGIPMVLTLHDYKLLCPSYSMLNRGEVCQRCRQGRFYNCATQGCHKGNRLYSLIYTVESYANRWLQRYQHVKRLICPSRFMAGLVGNSWLRHPHLDVIPNAVDPRRLPAEPNPGDYLLYVGRLSPEKGLLTLLEAVSRLKGVPLQIVGDGPMRRQLDEAVWQLRCEDRITFRGYLQGEELSDAYRNAAALVLPSDCYENAPMSVLEAMACGKPVVGSRIGGIPEMVSHEETGLLFPAGDADTLSDHLQTLWTDSMKRMVMGKRGRARVEEQYSLERHRERLIETYDQALSA